MAPPPSRLKKNERPPTDPPLPPPLATSTSSSVAQGDAGTAFTALSQDKQKQTPTNRVSDRPVSSISSERIWASRPQDPKRLKDTIRDFHRFLTGLPFPLIKITPKVLARIICRVLASQGLMATNIAFDLALLFWRLIINIFFRSVQPRGAWRIPRPDEGPVIFVGAPHHNQFLDPLLLASEVRRGSGRRVAFLIAEKSLKRRFIGAAARLMQSISVTRAADSAKPGKGTITHHDSGDPCLLKGHQSNFTKQLVPKGQIVLPRATGYASAEVVEIISDTEVRIKKEFKDERALDALRGKLPEGPMDEKEGGREAGMEGCKYQCLPFVDQTDMYASVYERLAEGGCLGIFPEGGSHDRTELLPLKAGVVIMALGAMSANPGLRVRIVPVGLSYFHPHKFRSRAVVEFGAPVDVPRELVGLFEQGGDGKRKAVSGMMDLVFDGLKSVTVRAPDYETLMLIQAARRLYTPPGAHPSLSQVVELNRRFIVGYLEFKDDPRIMALKDEVLQYNKMLNYAGLRDHQVERATRAGWRSLGLLAYRLGLLAMWGGLALPGVLLNAPVIILAKIISHKKAKEALAASQVKLVGRDVIATWKVLVSLGFTPVLYCFYTGLATYLAHRYKLPSKHQIFAPIYILSILPTIAYSTLKFSEVGIDIYKSLPPLFVSLMPGNYKVIAEIQHRRAKISAEMHSLIDELAPQIWDDFESKKIVTAPTSSAPPAQSPGREEAMIWKQSTRDKTLDGKSPLAHPLAWADERLFGWGTRRGSATTRALTAAEFNGEKANAGGNNAGVSIGEEDEESYDGEVNSQEEEEGDYEAIFRMLSPTRLMGLTEDSPKSPRSPAAGRHSRGHSRSRSGSLNETFAEKRNRSQTDLKALSNTQPERLSPTVRTSALPDTSLSQARERRARGGASNGGDGDSPTSSRKRTTSLSEDISTDAFKNGGEAIRKEPFAMATRALEQSAGDAEGGQRGEGEKRKPRLEEMRSAEATPNSSSGPGSPDSRPQQHLKE